MLLEKELTVKNTGTSIFSTAMEGLSTGMLQSDGSMYLVGLFLRFGVPLGLTIILAWLLKNIDLQWLKEANGEKEVEKSDFPSIIQGCWILHNLSLEKSLSGDPQEGCWKVRVKFEGDLPDQCLECNFFTEGILENAA
jgi:hypothetical protein